MCTTLACRQSPLGVKLVEPVRVAMGLRRPFLSFFLRTTNLWWNMAVVFLGWMSSLGRMARHSSLSVVCGSFFLA